METCEANEHDDLVYHAKDLSYRILVMIRSIAAGGQCSARAFSHRDIPDRERLHLIAALADAGHNLPNVGAHPVEIDRQEVENAILVTEFIATRQQVPDGFYMPKIGLDKQHDEVVSGVNNDADKERGDVDTMVMIKEKHRQLDAIDATCRQSNSTIGGPRFNFSLGIGATIFLALLLLLSFTRLPGWSIFPCSLVVSVSVFYLTKKFSSRPLTWTESIDRLLADYDPIDKDAYRSLQKNAGEDGYIDRCRVSDWLVAERKALRIAHSGVAPVTSEFLRRIL